jgi:hypothetical protein
LIVRTVEPDPYSAMTVGTLINQFRDRWNGLHANIPRDAAQLFTGKDLDGTGIGVAITNSLCYPEAAYSVVEPNNVSCANFACKTDLSAHELGHIWSANHCSCPGWTMNAIIQSANRFHPDFDIPELIAFRDSRKCLGVGDACDGAGTIDCNENGVADDCELESGSSPDVDENGVIDECQPPPIPLGEAAADHRTRAITMIVPTAETLAPGTPTALRVRILELQNPVAPNPPSAPPPDYSAFEIGSACTDPLECIRWVGKPQLVQENQGQPQQGVLRAV